MQLLRYVSTGAMVAGLALALAQPASAGPFVPGFTVLPSGPPPVVLPPPDPVPSKEYSNGNCEVGAPAGPIPPAGACPNGTLGDRSATGPAVADPGQVIGWDGQRPGGVADWTDFSGTVSGLNDNQMQIDGLANNNDVFWGGVVGDTVHMLFSTDADHRIFWETPGAPMHGVWADGQPPYSPGVNGGNDIDQHGVNDVDGLEIWGPRRPEAPDADRFSLESGTHTGTADPLGISVWASPGPGAPAAPFWSTAEIAAAILAASGEEINEAMIDLDAMMVSGNNLLFSVDPVDDILDGGEIFVAFRAGGFGSFGAAGDMAHYLFHGGHLWNTEFEVMATYNTASENINALEAANIPEPATWGIAVLGLAGIGMARRWQRSG